jgi:hypothetical protein
VSKFWSPAVAAVHSHQHFTFTVHLTFTSVLSAEEKDKKYKKRKKMVASPGDGFSSFIVISFAMCM